MDQPLGLHNSIRRIGSISKANVRFQLEGLELERRPAEPLGDEIEPLVEAIERELVDDDTWAEGYEQYITGVGYTIVNRLAALRCLEVRGFIDEEVTVFREDGLTPAADRLVTEEFLMEDEAILQAYENQCETLADEIPSACADRALSEITTAGYHPNHKHRLVIDIIPLVEAAIVPKGVDEEIVVRV